MNSGFDGIRAEMNTRFAQVDGRFVQIEERLDSLYRTIVGGGVLILAALLAPVLLDRL